MNRCLRNFSVVGVEPVADQRPRLGTGHRRTRRPGDRRERRRAARRHRDRDADRHRIHAVGCDRRDRRVDHVEPADRALSARSLAAGIPHLRADRHRAAGRGHADDQRGAGASGISRRRCRWKPPRPSWTCGAPASARSSSRSGSWSCRSRDARSPTSSSWRVAPSRRAGPTTRGSRAGCRSRSRAASLAGIAYTLDGAMHNDVAE